MRAIELKRLHNFVVISIGVALFDITGVCRHSSRLVGSSDHYKF